MTKTNDDDPYGWDKIAREYDRNTQFSRDPDCIDRFIAEKARQSEGWAIAYALTQLAHRITAASINIAGVDDFTGQMRMGAALEWIAETYAKEKKEAAK